MGVYTQFKDGYRKETTFKDGTTLDDAADVAYLLGAISQESEWPSPTYDVEFTNTGVNAKEVAATLLWKSQAHLRGMLGITMQNGIPCWLAMGKSTTAGVGPYTHTIVPYTDGTLLPSVVWQHEESGTATAEQYQFQGVKVDSLVLSHDMGANRPGVLMAKLEIMAGYAKDPAFALAVDPALPATANTGPYVQLTRTWDYGGAAISLDGLEKIDITIINGLEPLYAHSWNTGVYTGQWPYAIAEAPRKHYQIDFTMHKATIERTLWTELITASNTKEAYFKWTRSANDYIAVTATDCQVTVHEIKTPDVKDKTDRVAVRLIPRALSIVVVDSIAGAAYGE